MLLFCKSIVSQAWDDCSQLWVDVGMPSGILSTSAGATWPNPCSQSRCLLGRHHCATYRLWWVQRAWVGQNKEMIANYSHPKTGPMYPPVPAGTACPGRIWSQQPPFPVGPCSWELAQPLSLSWFWNPHFFIHKRRHTLSPQVWCEIREQKDPTYCTALFRGP